MPKTCNEEGCHNPVWSKGLCKWHTPKKPITPRKPLKRTKLSNKPTKRHKDSKDAEYAAMWVKWNLNILTDDAGREYNVCECSGERLYDFQPYHLAHVISKGQLPAARCDIDNFVIVSMETHNAMDGTDANGHVRGDLEPSFLERLENISEKIRARYCI